jgi:branched-chain amino acid aminotransferase
LKVWLDGALVEEHEARISPSDRGLLLGDGVFETLRSYGGKPFALDAHLERLAAGARSLGIAAPLPETLAGAVDVLLAETGIADARIRITVTTGAGPPGLTRGGSRPTVLVTAASVREWPSVASALVAPWAHDEKNPLAGVKTTSRAESVVALAWARERGADEALFINSLGNLCEATTANVFVVRRGRVETPPLSAGCLPGITRDCVLRVCGELGVEAVEADIAGEAIADTDEMFLTSSTREVQALAAVDRRQVGSGAPGPLTIRLKTAFRRSIVPDGVA